MIQETTLNRERNSALSKSHFKIIISSAEKRDYVLFQCVFHNIQFPVRAIVKLKKKLMPCVPFN